MNKLPNEILEIIWSYDSTYHEKYKKCINEIKEIFKETNMLNINISNYIPDNLKNDVDYILKETNKHVHNINLIKMYWNKIYYYHNYELEVYKNINEIIYNVYYISYPNLKFEFKISDIFIK